MKEEVYMVLKLLTHLIRESPYGTKERVLVEGARGFVPVYATWEEAYNASEDGRFEIIRLTTQKTRATVG
ncbi:hypothetical protein [Flagellimonas nanhaiensis]|uniref:Uncharacterized protein n=1 Tax=Flagellimonas nanhaiensis TaxID=2292706 RepID=A0A371JP00_9FLAO|nr:hypothetical protein [Allomuricauda nanhaiensis]RDY58913.1 hypothetical protein DX873_14740 [Allomuricauda nanhaiensis]